jgi:hypothetical protein
MKARDTSSSLLRSGSRRPWVKACRRSVSVFGADEYQNPKSLRPFAHSGISLSTSQPSIRLIYVLPKLSDDGYLQCNIFHGFLNDDCVCLSYVWNFPPRPNPHVLKERIISMNGLLYPVRENLCDFLCMARHNGTRNSDDPRRFNLSVPIWIDALCIDQSNLIEKNHQVTQMGTIYLRASALHDWFGKADPENLGSLRTLELTGSHRLYSTTIQDRVWILMDDLTSLPEYKEPPLWDTETGVYIHRDPVFTSARERKIIDVLERPRVCDWIVSICCNVYWQRAWVVQEITLGKQRTFWFHTEPVDSGSIFRVYQLLQSMRTFRYGIKLVEDGARFVDFRPFRLPPTRGNELLDLMDGYTRQQCFDLRDRVYSLLSLSATQTRIEVDYSVDIVIVTYRVIKNHPGPLCLRHVSAAIEALDIRTDVPDSEHSFNVLNGPWVEFDVYYEPGYLPYTDCAALNEIGQILLSHGPENTPQRFLSTFAVTRSYCCITREGSTRHYVIRISLETRADFVAWYVI